MSIVDNFNQTFQEKRCALSAPIHLICDFTKGTTLSDRNRSSSAVCSTQFYVFCYFIKTYARCAVYRLRAVSACL